MNEGRFSADGRQLSLTVPGFLGDIETNHCVFQLEFEVEETADEIAIAVYELLPGKPAPRTSNGQPILCTAAAGFSTLTHELQRPIGERRVVWLNRNGEVPVSDEAKRRLPTDIPQEWAVRPVSNTGSAEWDKYRKWILPDFDSHKSLIGPVSLEVVSPYTRNFDRMEGLRHNEDHQIIKLHDGIEAILIQRPNNTHRLSFVVDHWFYDMVAAPEATADELIVLARSFEA